MLGWGTLNKFCFIEILFNGIRFLVFRGEMYSKQVGRYRIQLKSVYRGGNVINVPREIYDLLPENPQLYPPGQLELFFEDEIRFDLRGHDQGAIQKLKKLAPREETD